ncbi:MAG: DEAD/DEAH box helicase [Filomicrobium sp.]
MTFKELGLAAPILKALEGEGYTTPTPIQAQAIPPLLNGADLLGIAQTGTGKTAAFALPILTKLLQDAKPPMRKGCRALVLSPTRELASQIGESFRVYGKQTDLKFAVIFGGVDIRKQVKALANGVDVLIATPGRLLDHVREKTLILSGTEIMVLDEADQMLDMGFVKPIRQIASKLSRNRQNLFFSATMPKEIAGLADELLNDNPVKVSVTPVSKTADRVEQKIIHIEARKKRSLLVQLFDQQDMERTLVFTRTKRGADRVARHLETSGITAAAIHGNKNQRQRERALEAFRKANVRVLVATDIAARGIDIDGVSHVINFELPEVPEAYVHRIGRTARAGASGQAISLCDVGERDLLRSIERITRQKIPSEDRRGDDELEATPAPQRPREANLDGSPNGRPRRDRSKNRDGDRRKRSDKPRSFSNKQRTEQDATVVAGSEQSIADNQASGDNPHRKVSKKVGHRGQRSEAGPRKPRGERNGYPKRSSEKGGEPLKRSSRRTENQARSGPSEQNGGGKSPEHSPSEVRADSTTGGERTRSARTNGSRKPGSGWKRGPGKAPAKDRDASGGADQRRRPNRSKTDRNKRPTNRGEASQNGRDVSPRPA